MEIENTIPLLFWLSLFSIFYAYLGYHILLSLIYLIKQQPLDEQDIDQPSLSLVVAVFNEEDGLAKKLRNCLDLDYPEHLLEIVIISDGSTDKTNPILKRWAKKHPRLKIHLMGKTSARPPV